MTVYVMTHKIVHLPLPAGYQLMMLGAEDKKEIPDNYVPDNKGENISSKNKSYCELTGLYELWKNSNDDHVGLVHYRRFFTNKNYHSRFLMYLQIMIKGKLHLTPVDVKTLDDYLDNYDWVIPTKEIEMGRSLWSHYSKYHFEKDLVVTERVINDKYPEYAEAFDHFLHKQNKMSPFNMFYTSRDQMENYCKWLFSVLGDIEERVDISDYDDFQKRIFGFLAEELFNVWIEKHKELRIKYLTVYNTHLTTRKSILARFTNRGRVN